VVEGNCAVVGVALFDENVAIEAAHVGNGEDADTAEGACCNGKDLALGNVGAQSAFAVALEAEEGDGAGGNVALQRAAGEVGLAAFGLEKTVLDELVLNGSVGAHLAGGSIAAVEAHEGIGEAVVELAGDVCLVKAGGNGVVDVQQSDSVHSDTGADVLAESAVDIHLAGNGDTTGGKAGVYVAGLEAELLGECGPALVGKGNVASGALVSLGPVKKGELKLSHSGQKVGVVVAGETQLCGHILADGGDAFVVFVVLVADEKVKLGVLFDFDAQLVKSLDGGVAGEEVLGSGTEGDDLKAGDADESAGNGDELCNHCGDILGGADGIFGDVGLDVAHAQVVRTVQHAAVSVASAVDKVSVAFGGGNEHAGAFKIFGDKGLGSFGTEVAKENDKRVAPGSLDVGHGGEHILFVFNGDGAFVKLAGVGVYDGLAAADGKVNGETVAGDRDNAGLYLGNIAEHRLFFLSL